MIWSPQQDAALQAVDKWLREGEQQIFRLFGYAGTGKTTLVQHLAQDVDGRVIFAAFTGKAALVMQKKGCTGARTIHNLIYRWVSDDEHKQPVFTLNREESDLRGARLLIIDECSMVDQRMGEDLLSFDVPILVLGDTAQLPPVTGCGFFTEAEPDILLTEIHRQAEDNPIIAMSKLVREGGRLKLGKYGDSCVIRDQNDDELKFAADQILVGRNATRKINNRRQRRLREFTSKRPVADDKLVCLRNNHRKGLLNGGLWHVERADPNFIDTIPLYLKSEDSDIRLPVLTHAQFFDDLTGEELPPRHPYDQFDYGYALTVHKAQGSQWDNVVLIDEGFCFREHQARWLYTALTRAAQKITVML